MRVGPVAALLVLCASQAIATPFEVAVGESGKLAFDLPAGWSADAIPSGQSVAVRILSPDRTALSLTLAVLPLAADSPITSAAALRQFVEEQASRLQLTPQKLEILDLRSAQGSGFYFHMASPQPDSVPLDFHSGALLVHGHLANFTIGIRSGQEALLSQALALLASLNITPPAA